MTLQKYLQKYVLDNNTKLKPSHTSMKGGKWYIPKDKLGEFYDRIHSETSINIPIVEKMNDIFPFVLDIDLKYKCVLEERSYTDDSLETLLEHVWQEMKECIQLDDVKSFGTVLILEKEKPYPCSKGEYKSKDGIHIIFPDILIDKLAYKKIISAIVEKDKIKSIFDESSEIEPDNHTKQILDSSFSSWQLYKCGKSGESPYLVTKVYQISDDGFPDETEIDEFYQNPRNILNLASMCYRDKISIKYTPKFDNTFKKKSSSMSSSSMSSSSMSNLDDDIYGKAYYVDSNNVINPFKIVEEEQLKLVKALVKCLSKERAEDYGKWFDTALCLHNINRNLLNEWKEFSRQSSSYDPHVCDSKWESISSEHSGQRLGIASLFFWAKNDNEKMFLKAKNASLETFVDKSVRAGPDADYLVAKVIYESYKDEFISVNVKDEWYHFSGHRWERTLEGTILKTRVHNDIYKLYYEYQGKYHSEKEKEIMRLQDEGMDATEVMEGKSGYGKLLKNIGLIMSKLLQGNYVNGVMKNLRDMFYEKEIMQKFDTDTGLLGFENGIYDLKNNTFREGRPEDYVTMSTKVSLPVKECDMPIKLNDMLKSFDNPDVSTFKDMEYYDRFHADLDDFLTKIAPNQNVKDYLLKFLAKCLSGDNRDEGFYIWTGTGGNGKSKLIDLMSMCMGDYACNLPIALLTQKRKASGAASPEMALTLGKRLCVMQEPDVNETMNIGQMKELTGNDKIQARALFKEPFFFTPQFKLVCMCNDLPNIPSNDDGTWRRLEVADFVSRFVDDPSEVKPELNRYIKDKSIKTKIPMWVVPFYSMLLPNWREYDCSGITIPNEIKAKTNEYRGDNDIIGQWISQECEPCDNMVAADNITKMAPTEYRTLYAGFQEWCEEVLGRDKNNIPEMSAAKTALKKWQEKSEWGLNYGKRKDQAGPNGYEANMLFNLKISK
jgi:P4 family phage/plasmid primase-like protien